MILIGIDPGVETGFAKWDTVANALRAVCGMPMFDAMLAVKVAHGDGGVLVMFEDARKHRIAFGRHAGKRQVLQGVGSVKRDCGLWEDFLTREGIPFVTVRPKRRATKKDAALFNRITGWTGRTNEHGRDAAMSIYGINTAMAESLLRESEQRRAAA